MSDGAAMLAFFEYFLHTVARTSLPLFAVADNALATPPTLSPQEAQVLVHALLKRPHAEKATCTQADNISR